MAEWIQNVTVENGVVKFCVSCVGETFSIVLKNAGGVVEGSISQSCNGCTTRYEIPAKSTGVHTLEMTCNWSTPNPCHVVQVNVSSLPGQNGGIGGIIPIAVVLIGLYVVLAAFERGKGRWGGL